MTRKIDQMYEVFGYAENGYCKDCQHYKKLRYRDQNYRKCEVYGITSSKASDWAGKYPACGLYPDKPYKGDRAIIELRSSGKNDEQIEGQLSLF